MGSGNPRTIIVPDADFRITLDVASLYEPAVKFAAHHCKEMFDGLLDRKDVMIVAKKMGFHSHGYKRRKENPDIRDFNPNADGTIKMKVQSFTSDTFYEVKIPFIEKDTMLERLSGNRYGCECGFYNSTAGKKDFDMCKHQIYTATASRSATWK